MLGYTAHDVDDLSVSDFLNLCDALERFDAQQKAMMDGADQ